MCRQSDQSWRAASLSGGKLWWDPALAPEDETLPNGGGNDQMDTHEVMMQQDDEKRAKGTVRRRLWKKMCRSLAKAVSSPPLIWFLIRRRFEGKS